MLSLSVTGIVTTGCTFIVSKINGIKISTQTILILIGHFTLLKRMMHLSVYQKGTLKTNITFNFENIYWVTTASWNDSIRTHD